MTQLLRQVRRRLLAPYRERGGVAVTWTVRLTLAAVASYVVARALFPDSDALLAPLTALLVVQLTPVSLLNSGLDRVLSVVAGVGVAVAFSSVVGVSWWSLGLLIAVSLLISIGLRLGNNALEVPISAMLVLGAGVGGAESAAWQRMAETLVGALVGVVANLALPPRVADKAAERAIQNLAEELARLLEDAASGVERAVAEGESPAGLIGDLLGRVRGLTHRLPNVGRALLDAEESRRLNVRAIGTPDVGPVLRRAVEALEHSAIAVRGVFSALDDVSRARDRRPEDFRDDLDVLAVSLLLRELALAFKTFGALVVAEVSPWAQPPPEEETAAGIDALQEARARLSDLVTIDRRNDIVFAELTFSLLTMIERVARELDLTGRAERIHRRSPPSRRRDAVRSLGEERWRTRGAPLRRWTGGAPEVPPSERPE